MKYNSTKLFASYYFLSTDIVDHSFESSNILIVLAEFAALTNLIYKSLGFLGRFLNRKIIIAKLIRSMYFIKYM